MKTTTQTYKARSPEDLAAALELLSREARAFPSGETLDEFLHHINCAHVAALRLAFESALQSGEATLAAAPSDQHPKDAWDLD